MLNKELLLSGPQEDEWHFEITVGENRNLYAFGYATKLFGEINRIPYFEGDTKLRLNNFYCDGDTYISTYDITPSEERTYTFTDDKGTTIEITDVYLGFNKLIRMDPFGIYSNKGKKIKLKVDPPPQVTSIPLLWNLSVKTCSNLKKFFRGGALSA